MYLVHTRLPNLVSKPSSSNALNECNDSKAMIKLSTGGASMKSK